MKKVLAILLILNSFSCFGGIASHAWTSPDEKIYFDDKCKNFEDCLLHSDIGYWNKILRWIGVKYDVDEALENAKDPFGSEWVETFEEENSEEEKIEIFNTALRVIAPEGSEKFFNIVKKLRKCEPALNGLLEYAKHAMCILFATEAYLLFKLAMMNRYLDTLIGRAQRIQNQ